ncbi:MAG TPA: hypothetical protein DEG69_20410 [Flavobacteriaceae bacterium]|nr:hypothetical protein [Flavobacteriaceae bacterium]
MAKFPHLPLWTDAYIADTIHLNYEEHGLYLMLLMTVWRSPECRIPNDIKWIKRRLRATDEQIEKYVKNILDEFFETTGNYITQKRLKEEYNYVKKKAKKNSDTAKLRWQKEKLVCERNAPTPTPILSNKDTKVSLYMSKKTKRRIMPVDWEPNENAAKVADKEGYTNEERSEILQQFRDYADANNAKYANWDKAFSNWLRNDITKRFVREKRRGLNPIGAGSGQKSASLASTIRNLSVVDNT